MSVETLKNLPILLDDPTPAALSKALAEAFSMVERHGIDVREVRAGRALAARIPSRLLEGTREGGLSLWGASIVVTDKEGAAILVVGNEKDTRGVAQIVVRNLPAGKGS